MGRKRPKSLSGAVAVVTAAMVESTTSTASSSSMEATTVGSGTSKLSSKIPRSVLYAVVSTPHCTIVVSSSGQTLQRGLT